MTLKQYIREKIRMLTKDFCIPLTEEELDHFATLTTEIQVDNYTRHLFAKYL